MYARYKGGGEYVCNHLRSQTGVPACQSIRASRVDAAVAAAFLTALAPAEIDALSRARRAQQQVEKALRSSAERELERKRYAAALAEQREITQMTSIVGDSAVHVIAVLNQKGGAGKTTIATHLARALQLGGTDHAARELSRLCCYRLNRPRSGTGQRSGPRKKALANEIKQLPN